MGWEPARSQNRMNPSQPVCWACELRCSTSSARHPPHPPEPGPLHLLAPGQISGTDARLLIWPHLEQVDHNRSMDYWEQGMTGAIVLFVKLETSHSLSHKLLGRWFPILARIRLRNFPHNLTFCQKDVHIEQMPSGVSTVSPHQSSTNYESLSKLLFMAGNTMSGHNIWQIGTTELMQPITDQLLCPVLEWKNVFGHYVSIYLKCCQDIMSTFLEGEQSSNVILYFNMQSNMHIILFIIFLDHVNKC